MNGHKNKSNKIISRSVFRAQPKNSLQGKINKKINYFIFILENKHKNL